MKLTVVDERNLTAEQVEAIKEKEYSKVESHLMYINNTGKFNLGVDIETSCAKAETAIKRLFKGIDLEKYPEFDVAEETMLESIRGGVWEEKTEGCACTWGVEFVGNEESPRWYAYFNTVSNDKIAVTAADEVSKIDNNEQADNDELNELFAELETTAFETLQFRELHGEDSDAVVIADRKRDAITEKILNIELGLMNQCDTFKEQYSISKAIDKEIDSRVRKGFERFNAWRANIKDEKSADIIRFEVGKIYKNKNFYRVIERKNTEYGNTICTVEEIDGRMQHQSFIHIVDGVETVKNLYKGETLNADTKFELFDESILTPENTPTDFEDFTVEVYDDNEDQLLNLDEDGLTPYFDDVRKAIKYAKDTYFQTGLNVTVVQLNTSTKFSKNTDLPLYGIYSGEEMIYNKLEEVLQAIENKKAESENPADIILDKIICTIAYSGKIGNRKAINSIYSFVKEAENKGFIDLARKIKFKTITACWGDSLDNFYIEDYLKLLA